MGLFAVLAETCLVPKGNWPGDSLQLENMDLINSDDLLGVVVHTVSSSFQEAEASGSWFEASLVLRVRLGRLEVVGGAGDVKVFGEIQMIQNMFVLTIWSACVRIRALVKYSSD